MQEARFRGKSAQMINPFSTDVPLWINKVVGLYISGTLVENGLKRKDSRVQVIADRKWQGFKKGRYFLG